MIELAETNKGNERWKSLFKSIEFFGSFNDGELDDMLNFSRVKKYNAREFIIREKVEADSFYVLLKGSINIIKDVSNFETNKTVYPLDSGDCFGEMSLLLNDNRCANVMARSECYVLEIKSDEIENLSIETQAKLFRQFATHLAKRMKMADEVRFNIR